MPKLQDEGLGWSEAGREAVEGEGVSPSRRTFGDLVRVLGVCRELRGILYSLLGFEHPIIKQIAWAYSSETKIAFGRWMELLTAYRRSMAHVRTNVGQSLEILERAVALMIHEAVEARHFANRAKRRRRKNPTVMKALAAQASAKERHAREAVRGLIQIANGRGADVEWIIRENKLQDWL